MFWTFCTPWARQCQTLRVEQGEQNTSLVSAVMSPPAGRPGSKGWGSFCTQTQSICHWGKQNARFQCPCPPHLKEENWPHGCPCPAQPHSSPLYLGHSKIIAHHLMLPTNPSCETLGKVFPSPPSPPKKRLLGNVCLQFPARCSLQALWPKRSPAPLKVHQHVLIAQ